MTFRRMIALAALAALLFAAADAGAQMRGKGGKGGGRNAPPPPELPDEAAGVAPDVIGAFFAMHADLEHMRAKGFLPTGLKPVYPADAACPVMDSMFATTVRGDGSPRSRRFFQGYHGGADIPVPEGTPILAIADGTLVHKNEGRNIGGIGVVLQHAPEDTGLPVWTYTEYKHLIELPALEIGARVKRGQVLAKAGLTGTTGGHYGEDGHSHLHLAAYLSPGKDYRGKVAFIPVDGQWMDPLALYRRPPIDSQALAALPAAEKAVPISYQRPDGSTVPADARVIWPFACPPR